MKKLFAMSILMMTSLATFATDNANSQKDSNEAKSYCWYSRSQPECEARHGCVWSTDPEHGGCLRGGGDESSN